MEGSVVAVNVDAVKKAITKKTVAIMVIHPFGMISTNTEKMKELRLVATEHKLHILEDCAECFTGLAPTCYKGSQDAHVSFFSFGTIKTATALGGGIAIIRNDDMYDKMHRMHHFLYPEQARTQYLCKVLWCVVVRFIVDYPLLYGILFAVVSCAGLDFDVIVSSCIRSFVPKDSIQGKNNGSRQNDPESRMSYTDVINQLRRRPSCALLLVILRRLEQCRQRAPSVQARVEQCRYMASMLEKLAPNVIRPEALSESAENFWLFPIQVTSPDTVSQHLCKEGFDVPRGLSQLECVRKYSSPPTSCPRAEELMDGILYLPVSSRSMTKGEMRRMAAALNVATTPVSGTDAEIDVVCNSCKSLRNARKRGQRLKGLSAAVVSVVFVDGWFFQCIPLSGPIYRAAWAGIRFFTALLSVAILGAVVLRWYMADFYVSSSQCFSKYNSMLFRQPQRDEESSTSCERSEDDKSESDKPLLNMDVLRIPKVRAPKATATGDLLQSPVVLLTGATGFIGRLLLRDLLLHRQALAIEGGVVVICRSKRGKSAQNRISVLLDDPMYSFLSREEKQKLVRVVEGDVTKSNVGLSPSVIQEICNGLDVSHVIHCAASVSFTQTLQEAAVSNVSSSLNLKSLTGRLKSKSAKYVHISTAFVHGGQTGTACDPLPEQLHCLDGYDAVDLYRSMLGTQYVASSAMKDLRFPNTYTFSKCICEHLLARETNVPTIVIRPSIVGPAVQHPYEGWAGDKPTTIVAAACLYMSYQWNLWCFGNHHVPVIPVDVVSAFVIAKAFDDDSGASDGTCDSPTAYSSDDSYERVSQLSDSSNSESDNETGPSPAAPLVTRLAQSYKYRIHTLAWDTSSPDSSMFSWIDYAVAITHLGAVLGHFSRFTAYLGLLVAVRLLPGMGLNTERFKTLHRVLVQFPIDMVVSSFKLLGWCPLRIAKLSKLSTLLDLPLLFFPFMNVNFHFSSELVAPADMDGERYLFSCLVAAKRFMGTIQSRHQNKVIPGSTKDVSAHQESAETNPSVLVVGGISHKPPCADFWWSLTQPRGNVFVRLAGWGFRKILRASSVAVTVDVELFSASMLAVSSGMKGERPHLILAPNHRSFFDFILISYICFSLPELNIEIPFIAAADDFEHLPIFGWLAAKTNAFFVRRGRGKADPCLAETLDALKKDNGNQGVCIEVFIEGSRSRDRRFLRPKTGMLRYASVTGLFTCVHFDVL
jgi:glycerone phosphate O-acyltransferase